MPREALFSGKRQCSVLGLIPVSPCIPGCTICQGCIVGTVLDRALRDVQWCVLCNPTCKAE
jgi:hypothetical protein